MKPEVAVFTRDDQCKKYHWHNAFFDGTRYVNRPLVEVQHVTGRNAPKYLLREGFMVQRLIGGVDMYCLTPEGDQWLRRGILRYLALHPEDIDKCTYPPIGFAMHKHPHKPPAKGAGPAATPSRPVVRRTKPTAQKNAS